MLNKNQLSKIGIGTWGIGGYVERDKSNNDNKQVDALIYMLDNNLNFIETGMWAAESYSARLTAKALKESSKQRNDTFITQTVYHFTVNTVADIQNEVDQFLEIFETNYIDALQFNMHCIQKIGFDEISTFVDTLIQNEIIRYTSITNASLEYLQQYHQRFSDKLFAHEVGFNFEIRENEQFGIMQYATTNNILNVVFQPLRRDRTAQKNYPVLIQLAEKYDKTQNQIIMNWIISKGYLPITKSSNKTHIDEHLESLLFQMEDSDIQLLNDFQVPNYKTPKIDWDGTGDGVKIDQLSNKLDEIVEANKA